MIDSLGSWCADFAVRRRWPVLIVASLLVLGGIWPALHLPYDASYEIWFLEGDPALESYRDFQQLFGNDEFVLLMTEAPEGTVFRNDILESVERLTRELESTPYIRGVTSLTRYEHIRGEEDGLLVEALIPGLPMDPEALRTAERRVLADSIATATVTTPDGRVAVVSAELKHLPGEYRHRMELVERIETLIARERTDHGIEYLFTGEAVLDKAVLDKTRSDLMRNIPLVILVVALVLAFTVRSWAGTLFPLGVVLAAVVLARVMTPVFGWKDNSMLTMVPLVVMAVGVADSVHIVVHYLRLRGGGFDGPAAARETIRRLFKPCLLTTFTTAVGFLALLTASLAPLRQMGVLTSIGVVAAFLFTVLPLPAALSLLRGDYTGYTARLRGGLMTRFTVALPRFVRRHRARILVAAGAVTVLGVAGITRLEVESNAIRLFRDNDPIRVEGLLVEEKIGGIGSLEVVVSAPEEGGIQDPELLRAMDDLIVFLKRQPLVSDAHSVTDYLKSINAAMHGDDPAFRVIPDSPALVAQYLLLYEASSEEQALESFVDLTRRHARVWARTDFGSSSEYKELQDAVSAYAAERFPPEVEVDLTGLVTLYRNMGDYVIRSQVRSFLFALVIITLTMVITFRSWRIGLLSLIPNVWPIVVTVGLMGWTGIWLEPATAMVAAVVIGIAVDDSVHFLNKYMEGMRGGKTLFGAVDHAFEISGRAIVFTTVILLSGFIIIMISEFKPYTNFGMLCGIAILLALVGDLLVLPAIFLKYRPLRIEHRRGSRAARAATGASTSALAVLLLAGAHPGAVQAQPPGDPAARGREIMEALERTGEDVRDDRAEVVMILQDRRGKQVERRAEIAFLDLGNGEQRSLIRFSEPADLRGTAFLTHIREGEDDQWLYLPALKRVKRIAASKRSGNFVGTEFTYEDLGGRELDDFDYRHLGEETVEGETCDVVEAIPRHEHSGYSRMVHTVSRERLVVLGTDYYDREGDLVKRGTASEFTRPDDRHWRPGVLRMENVQNGRSTILRVESQELNAGLDPARFTVESLESGW